MAFFTIHLVHALIIALGGVCYGAAIVFYSPCGDPMTQEFEWKPIQATIFNTLILFCSAISAPFINTMLKFLSRKRLTLILAVVTIVGWILICVAQKSFSWLSFVGRVITGLTCGCLSGLCSMYIVELAPPDCRGSYGVFGQLMCTIGQCYVYLLGVFCKWRTIAYAILPLPIIFSILMWFVPESPVNGVKSVSTPIDTPWQKKYVKSIITSILLVLFQQTSGINPILTNLENIFKEAHVDLKPAICCLLVGIAQVIATTFSSPFVGKLGRRPSWITSATGQSVALLLCWLKCFWNYNPFVSVVALFVDVSCFGLAFGPVPWLMVPELFPDSIRALMQSLISCLNWLLASGITFLWPVLQDAITTEWGFFIFGLFCAIAAAFGIFFMPETKGMVDEAEAMREVNLIEEGSMTSESHHGKI